MGSQVSNLTGESKVNVLTEISSSDRVFNWPLFFLISLIPLQNIYIDKLPNYGSGINALNVLLLASFFVWRWRPELSKANHSVLHKPIMVYIVLFALSTINGRYTLGYLPENSLQSLKDMYIPLLLYFIVLASVRDQRGIQWMILATFIPLPYMFRVFYIQYQSVSAWHYSDNFRLVKGTFMMLGSNELAAFYVGYTFLLIALVVVIKRSFIRGGLIALTSINLYAVLYSHSRAAWISFLVAGFVVLWVRNKRLAVIGYIVGTLFGSALMTVLPTSVQERFETIFVEEGEERDESAASRFILWDIASEKIAESPIFGKGYNTFRILNPYQGKDTHNYYVKLLVEEGILGFGVFIVILWRTWSTSFLLYKKTDDRIYKALGLGMVGCVSAFVVGNFFGDRFSHYPMIAYFWVYAALVQRALNLSGINIGPDPQKNKLKLSS